MKVTRRTALKSGLVVAVGFAVIGISLKGKFSISSAKTWLSRFTKFGPIDARDYLKKNFAYLDLQVSDEQFENFYNNYTIDNHKISQKAWDIATGRGEEYHRVAIDNMATAFLMSTDFFLNGADESKPVNYIGCFSPYITPCWNPVSTRGSQFPTPII